MPKNSGSGISRRGFIQGTVVGALTVGPGSFAPVTAARSPTRSGDPTKADSTRTTRKIALEEHFTLPESSEAGYAELRDVSNLRLKLLDVGSGRIAEMDRCGLEICILSHNGPAIQAIPEVSQAIATSRRTNDYLAEHIAKNPNRLKGFAALPLHDPQA